MLGVRRETITDLSQKPQMTGAITSRRGHLTIVDRQELESRTGESYTAAKEYY